MQEKGGAAHGHDVGPVIVGLSGHQLSEKAGKFSGQGFDASKGADQSQSSRFMLLQQFQSNPRSDRSSHNDDIFLLEAQLPDRVVVDIGCVFPDDLAVRPSSVDAVARVLHC